MSNTVIKEHFRNPRNRRSMAGADGTGSAGDEGCGARIEVSIRFNGNTISEAAYTATGSSAIIAAGSVLTGMLEHMKWRQAAALPATAIAVALGGEDGVREENGSDTMDAVKHHGSLAQAAFFAIEALHGAFEDSLKRGTFPATPDVSGKSVVAAMSGGVDSSVACMMLKSDGRDVIGLTMRLWSDPECTDAESGPSCCSPQAISDARAVCHSLGLPHLTVDYSDVFESSVVEYFVSEYLLGHTPNPCTYCNGRFRFAALVDLARRLGASKVATGHYARLVEWDGKPLIARGSDRDKDQSYMLWGIDSSLLSSLEFPLGGMEKTQTRELARQAGLVVYDRPDSQEVCFIPDDDYRRFLSVRLEADGAEPFRTGDIVDKEGHVLGRHSGYLNYTVGQRRGLGVSAPEPLYVIGTEPAGNLVVVGSREELAVSKLEIGSINTFLPFDGIDGVDVQVRYNSDAIAAKVDKAPASGATGNENDAGPAWKLKLMRPAYGVAKGQSAVLYSDNMVVAGGVIRSAQ